MKTASRMPIEMDMRFYVFLIVAVVTADQFLNSARKLSFHGVNRTPDRRPDFSWRFLRIS